MTRDKEEEGERGKEEYTEEWMDRLWSGRRGGGVEGETRPYDETSIALLERILVLSVN